VTNVYLENPTMLNFGHGQIFGEKKPEKTIKKTYSNFQTKNIITSEKCN
jgi:hypothetical protein